MLGRAVAVVGTGGAGLVVASCLAGPERPVVAVEPDRARRAALRQGRLPFFEPGLEALFREALGCGWLELVDEPPTQQPTVYCLPEGLGGPGGLDHLVGRAREGSVLVLQAPGPVGTARWLQDRVRERRGHPAVAVVSNPLLLRRGQAVRDFLRPAWVLLGGEEAWAVEAVASLYRGRGALVVRTDCRTAEAAGAVASALPGAFAFLLEEVRRLTESWGADFEVICRLVLPALVEGSRRRYVHGATTSGSRDPARFWDQPRAVRA